MAESERIYCQHGYVRGHCRRCDEGVHPAMAGALGAQDMNKAWAGGLSLQHPLAGAVSTPPPPAVETKKEFLLADELRMEAFKAQARKRKEEADDQRRAKAAPEHGEAENTLALVREVMAKAARDGQHACDVKIVKHAVREWCAEQLRAEGLVAIDRKDSLTLCVEWAL